MGKDGQAQRKAVEGQGMHVALPALLETHGSDFQDLTQPEDPL